MQMLAPSNVPLLTPEIDQGLVDFPLSSGCPEALLYLLHFFEIAYLGNFELVCTRFANIKLGGMLEHLYHSMFTYLPREVLGKYVYIAVA